MTERVGRLGGAVASVSRRVDRLDLRLDRVEERLDAVAGKVEAAGTAGAGGGRPS